MDAYRSESAAIMEILRTVTPVIEKVSVNEAYLDVSASFDAAGNDDDALEAAKVKAPPRFEVKAPTEAPNVLILLLDDSAPVPAIEANQNLRTKRFERKR
jgi:nucleotidyltransferase/DNA polymerase involved in DNA repair